MPLPPLLKSLRPHQWTKNLSVFVGILFAQKLADWTVIKPVLILFVGFCAVSSAVYLINDVHDREEDRKHPTKRFRPIASGKVAPGTALVMAGVLAVTAMLIGWFLRGTPLWGIPPALVALATYFLLNLAYTLHLKTMPIADVSCVALGFLIRVVTGPAVALLEVSPWLILCTFFGSLFLATAKRRGEMFATADTGSGRKVLQDYTPEVLNVLVGQAATATLVCYALYTVSDQTVAKFGTPHLLYTIPIVFFGLGRYLVLLYRHKKGEDPSSLLFTDRPMIVAVLAWLLVSGIIIGL